MLDKYLHAAMQKAQYRIDADDSVFGEIPEFENVRARCDSLESCQQELMEALEEWVFFHISRELPLPTIDGIEPTNTRIH